MQQVALTSFDQLNNNDNNNNNAFCAFWYALNGAVGCMAVQSNAPGAQARGSIFLAITQNPR